MAGMHGPAAQKLKQELLLQVNQRLYQEGLIPEELYRQAKVRIVNGT